MVQSGCGISHDPKQARQMQRQICPGESSRYVSLYLAANLFQSWVFSHSSGSCISGTYAPAGGGGHGLGIYLRLSVDASLSHSIQDFLAKMFQYRR
jgi:hypothetical protein